MRIGLLTGGGDCPGLNAAIRAVVRRAYELGHQVLGFLEGWRGPIENLTKPLTPDSVSGILHVGGTILGSSRTNPAKIPNGYEKILENLRKNELDALIVIGGEDTLSVAAELHNRGFKTIGIPKTIDNDVYGTDYCIGFFSAVTYVADAIDRLHTTAWSHRRVIVVEVMGREAGWLTLYGGLAGGADWIMIPEVQPSLDELVAHVKRRYDSGKRFSIVAVAEGVKIPEIENKVKVEERDAFGHVRLEKKGIAMRIADYLKEQGFEARHVVLGHVQRGGSPVVFDRLLGTRFGVAAVDALQGGKSGIMVGLQGISIVEVPLTEVREKSPRLVPQELWELTRVFY